MMTRFATFSLLLGLGLFCEHAWGTNLTQLLQSKPPFTLVNQAEKIPKSGYYRWTVCLLRDATNARALRKKPAIRRLGLRFDYSDVKEVRYKLHKLYPSPLRYVWRSAANIRSRFAVKSSGLGEFTIRARITLKGSSKLVYRLQYKLKLQSYRRGKHPNCKPLSKSNASPSRFSKSLFGSFQRARHSRSHRLWKGLYYVVQDPRRGRYYLLKYSKIVSNGKIRNRYRRMWKRRIYEIKARCRSRRHTLTFRYLRRGSGRPFGQTRSLLLRYPWNRYNKSLFGGILQVRIRKQITRCPHIYFDRSPQIWIRKELVW